MSTKHGTKSESAPSPQSAPPTSSQPPAGLPQPAPVLAGPSLKDESTADAKSPQELSTPTAVIPNGNLTPASASDSERITSAGGSKAGPGAAVAGNESPVGHGLPELNLAQAELREALRRAGEMLITINHAIAETQSQVKQLQQAGGRSDEKALQYRNDLSGELVDAKDALRELSQSVTAKLPAAVAAELIKDVEERLLQTEETLLEPLRKIQAEVASSLKTDLGPRVTETANAMAKLAGDEQTRYHRIRRAQREMQQSLDSNLGRLLGDTDRAQGTLKQQVELAVTALAALDQNQDKTQKSVDGLSRVVPTNLTERLENLSQSVEELARAAATQVRLDGVDRRVESIEKSVGSQLARELGAVELRVEGLRSDLISVSEGVNTTQVELKSELERTEKRLTDAIRDAGRTVDTLTRNLEETRLSVGKLFEATHGQHAVIVGNLSRVNSAIQKDLDVTLHPLLRSQREDVEKSMQHQLGVLRAQLSSEFRDKLDQTLLELKKQTEFVHDYLSREEKLVQQQTTAEKIRGVLAQDFKSLNDKFNDKFSVIDSITLGTKQQIERLDGPLDLIKKQTEQNWQRTEEIKKETSNISVQLGKMASFVFPGSFKGLVIIGLFLLLVVALITFLFSRGIEVSSGSSADKVKLQSIIDAQKELKQEWTHGTSGLMSLAQNSNTRLFSVESKLCNVAEAVAKHAAAPRCPAVNPSPPRPPQVAVQVTNSTSSCCGSGGQAGSNISCTCLGKTTTAAPPGSTGSESKTPAANSGPATAPFPLKSN